jgi:aspartokinase
MTNKPVSNINVTYNVALVTIDKLPNDTRLISDIFNAIAKRNINIDMISQAPPFRGASISHSVSLPQSL